MTRQLSPNVKVATRLESLREQWPPLAECSGSVFLTWEWLLTWWEFYGRGRELRLVTAHDDDRVVGVVPLYQWSARPARVLRLLGHGTSDQAGFVSCPEDREQVAAALHAVLRRERWDVLLAESVDDGAGWADVAPTASLRSLPSPVVRFGPEGWSGYLKGRSRNMREQLNRRPRALSREHDVRFRLVQDARELEAALPVLFRLHALRWPEGSQFLREQEFHRAFAARALQRGWLRLWLLVLDGEAVAATYGFRYAGRECFYQSGRDPHYERESVGFVLLAHAIRQAADEGMSEYQLLRGGEPYKSRFATDEPHVQTLALARRRSVLPLLSLAARTARLRRVAASALTSG